MSGVDSVKVDWDDWAILLQQLKMLLITAHKKPTVDIMYTDTNEIQVKKTLQKIKKFILVIKENGEMVKSELIVKFYSLKRSRFLRANQRTNKILLIFLKLYLNG